MKMMSLFDNAAMYNPNKSYSARSRGLPYTLSMLFASHYIAYLIVFYFIRAGMRGGMDAWALDDCSAAVDKCDCDIVIETDWLANYYVVVLTS